MSCGQYIDCSYETLTGEHGQLSDFEGRVKVLLYGRIGSCANTNGALSLTNSADAFASERRSFGDLIFENSLGVC